MKYLNTFLAVLLCTSAFAKVIEKEVTVYFETDAYELEQSHAEQLKQLKRMVAGHLDYSIVVRAHTDADGSDAYNDALAQKRAESIENHLLTILALDPIEFFREEFGEKLPVADNHSLEGKELNRRVQVILKIYEWENVDEVMNLLVDNRESITMNATTRNTVRSKSGILLDLPAKVFVYENGETATGVTLELTEAINQLEWMKEGLSCSAGGDILESGGMFRLEAFDDEGRALSMADGQEIGVELPTANERMEGMTVFISESGQNWTNTSTPFSSGNRIKMSYSMEIPSPPRRPFEPVSPVKKPAFKLDLASKPRKPVVPLRPNQPKLIKYTPAVESGSKRRRRETAKSNALHKQRTFKLNNERRMRYERMVEQFVADSIAYPQNQLAFEQELAAWTKREQERRIEHRKMKFTSEDSIHDAYMQRRMANYDREMARYRIVKLEYDSLFSIWKSDCDSVRKARNDAFEKAITSGEASNIDETSFKRYTASISKLGWVNCDRFYTTPESEKQNIYVKIEPSKRDNSTFLRLNDANSMIALSYLKTGACFQSIPKNVDATIVSYRIGERGIEVAQEEPQFMFPVKLNYEVISLKEFKALFNA